MAIAAAVAAARHGFDRTVAPGSDKVAVLVQVDVSPRSGGASEASSSSDNGAMGEKYSGDGTPSSRSSAPMTQWLRLADSASAFSHSNCSPASL